MHQDLRNNILAPIPLVIVRLPCTVLHGTVLSTTPVRFPWSMGKHFILFDIDADTDTMNIDQIQNAHSYHAHHQVNGDCGSFRTQSMHGGESSSVA